MKRFAAPAFAVALIFIITAALTGCDLDFTSSENLIRPPRISGENGALELCFEKATADIGDIILRYPASGAHRSAFVRYDCDGDGDDEAFVFYSPASNEMSVNMYMLDHDGGEWKPVMNIVGDGSDIYSIEFVDLDGDGISEIIAGWSNFDSKNNNTLTVYCPVLSDAGALTYQAAAIESFTYMQTVNVDDDDVTELVIALIDKNAEAPGAQLKTLELGEVQGTFVMNVQARAQLFAGVTSINGIFADSVQGKKRLFIDESADGSYFTELFYCSADGTELSPAFELDGQSLATCPTLRSVAVSCADVNRDGILEIPVSETMDGSFVYATKEGASGDIPDDDTVVGNVSLTKWCACDENGALTQVSSAVINSFDGFSLKWDERILSWSTVNMYPDRGMTEVLDDEGNVLFSVIAVDAADADNTEGLIAVTATTAYIANITPAGIDYGITDNLVTGIFLLI